MITFDMVFLDPSSVAVIPSIWKFRQSSLELIHLNTGITGVTVATMRGTGSSDTVCILVEKDVAIVFNELALPEDTVHLTPTARSTLEFDARWVKNLAKSSGRFPGMVVGYLAADVMCDVGLRDAVSRMGTNPSHDLAAVTKKLAIKSSESSAGESELGGTVMGKNGVGVLEEGDEDKPVVYPEVGNDVKAEDRSKSVSMDEVSNRTKPKQDANIGKNDLSAVVGLEHDGAGAVVVGTLGVSPLTRCISRQVHKPTADQVGSTAHGSTNGRVANGIPEFLLDFLADAGAVDVFLGRVKWGKANLRPGLRNENLILGHVAGGSVVLRMCYPPRVIRYTEGRVKDPANEVVHSFGLGEGLVAALMGNNPKTSGEKTNPKAVNSPESEAGKGVEVWVR